MDIFLGEIDLKYLHIEGLWAQEQGPVAQEPRGPIHIYLFHRVPSHGLGTLWKRYICSVRTLCTDAQYGRSVQTLGTDAR